MLFWLSTVYWNLSLSWPEVENHKQQWYVLSDGSSQYWVCTNEKDRFNREFPNYIRSECFSYQNQYHYFICDRGGSECNIRQNSSSISTYGETQVLPSISATVVIPHKVQLDRLVASVKEKNDERVTNNFLKNVQQLWKQYKNNPSISLMASYLEQETQKILTWFQMSEEEAFLCTLAGTCASNNMNQTAQTSWASWKNLDVVWYANAHFVKSWESQEFSFSTKWDTKQDGLFVYNIWVGYIDGKKYDATKLNTCTFATKIKNSAGTTVCQWVDKYSLKWNQTRLQDHEGTYWHEHKKPYLECQLEANKNYTYEVTSQNCANISVDVKNEMEHVSWYSERTFVRESISDDLFPWQKANLIQWAINMNVDFSGNWSSYIWLLKDDDVLSLEFIPERNFAKTLTIHMGTWYNWHPFNKYIWVISESPWSMEPVKNSQACWSPFLGFSDEVISRLVTDDGELDTNFKDENWVPLFCGLEFGKKYYLNVRVWEVVPEITQVWGELVQFENKPTPKDHQFRIPVRKPLERWNSCQVSPDKHCFVGFIVQSIHQPTAKTGIQQYASRIFTGKSTSTQSWVWQATSFSTSWVQKCNGRGSYHGWSCTSLGARCVSGSTVYSCERQITIQCWEAIKLPFTQDPRTSNAEMCKLWAVSGTRAVGDAINTRYYAWECINGNAKISCRTQWENQ